MPNYQNGKIYKLWSPQGDDIYIGSTTLSLSRRKVQHVFEFKKGKGISSKLLFEKYNDVRIELLEECPCENKEQLVRKEGEYIRNNICVNKIIAGRTGKEYYEDNKEKIIEYNEKNKDKINERRRERYQKNKEVINEKQREYYEKNKDIINQKHREYHKKNREVLNEKKKEYTEKNKDKFEEYREKNRDIINERRRERYQKNKEVINEKAREKRRLNKLLNQ